MLKDLFKKKSKDTEVYKKDEVLGSELTFLIGEQIVSIQETEDIVRSVKLETKSGYVLEIEENEGCGGCGAGMSVLPEMKAFIHENNAIMDIKTEYVGKYIQEKAEYTIFVYFEDGTLKQSEGDNGIDSGGGYGRGYSIKVKRITKK